MKTKIIYCKECLYPNTKPNLFFDDRGVCSACISYKSRNEIDWSDTINVPIFNLTIPKNIKDPIAYQFCYQPTLWPKIDGFREIWESYYSEMENFAKRIMSAFAEALDLEHHYFDDFINNPISALRALHYPATKNKIFDK